MSGTSQENEDSAAEVSALPIFALILRHCARGTKQSCQVNYMTICEVQLLLLSALNCCCITQLNSRNNLEDL